MRYRQRQPEGDQYHIDGSQDGHQNNEALSRYCRAFNTGRLSLLPAHARNTLDTLEACYPVRLHLGSRTRHRLANCLSFWTS